jgi:hypothetical protein
VNQFAAKAVMNRLDVRALGWVVTRDMCSEIACVALGRRQRMSRAALERLRELWRAVVTAPTADRSAHLKDLLVADGTTAVSPQRHKAVVEFVDTLQDCFPHLYSEQALRHRCFNACGQATVSLALGAVLACWSSADVPIIGSAALVLFAIAFWSLVTTIQFCRAYRLVKDRAARWRFAGGR